MKIPCRSLGIAVFLGALALPSAALAEEPPDVAAAGSGNFCAVSLDTGEAACADDRQTARQEANAQANVLAVSLYDRTGASGTPRMDLYVPERCSEPYDYEYGFNELPGFNNRASSVSTASNCDVMLFDGTNMSGAQSVWIHHSENLAQIGNGWNNRASSVLIS